MRLAITLLGLDLLTIDLDTGGDQSPEACDVTTYPVGFTASPGDQRWEQGAELS